jgi:cytochrome c biogenesis protein CcdA/DsbC/DsbD-like thiol-disulfide interchange protein
MLTPDAQRWRLAAAAVLVLGVALPGIGQAPRVHPVRISAAETPESLVPGEAFTVAVGLRIARPYHIYGLKPAGPEFPTRVQLVAQGDLVELAGGITPDRPPREHREEFATYDFYEDEVTFRVPLRLSAAARGEVAFGIAVEVVACDDQGCLPLKRLVQEFRIPVAPPPQDPVQIPGLGEDAKARIAAARFDPSDSTARLEIRIAPGWHIYGLKALGVEYPTRIRVARGPAGLRIAGPIEPSRPPELKEGESEFDRYEYWEGEVVFRVPLAAGEAPPAGAEATLEVDLMTCDASGCLPPLTLEARIPVSGVRVDRGAAGEAPPPAAARGPLAADLAAARVAPKQFTTLRIELPPGDGLGAPAVHIAGASLAIGGVPRVNPVGRFVEVPVQVHAQQPEGGFAIQGRLVFGDREYAFAGRGTVRSSLLAFLLLAATSALAALLTPCVFPMIPITISFFTKQGERSQRPAWVLGTIYCAGIVLSFTAIGVLFTVLIPGGAGAQNFALHWVTQLVIGLLFLVFAASLLGGFDLQLPASVMSLVGKAQSRGGTLGIWFLGLLFAVTSFTCTAPFVGGLLASAKSSADWTRPILGMVVFSGVLATPFFFLSAFPTRLRSLPRAGGWMNEVKVAMGFIEIAAAFKFLGGMDMALKLGVFTRVVVLAVWVVCFALTGFHLLGLFRLPHDAPRERTSVTGLAFAMLCLVFSIYLATGLGGQTLNEHIEPYLPLEDPTRSEAGRRAALAAELQGLLGAATDPGGSVQGGVREFKNQYAEARAAALQQGRLLFIDFTGYG